MTSTSVGPLPTGTVAITALVAVSITDTVLLRSLVTYTRVPPGVMASATGTSPTGTVAITVLVVGSITATVSVQALATHTRPAPVWASAAGVPGAPSRTSTTSVSMVARRTLETTAS